MNPWLIGGAGAALIALLASSASSTSASTDAMVFKDYTWVTSLPAMATTEARPPNPLAAQLPPPPGQAAGTGVWSFFPGGKLLLLTDAHGGGIDPINGGAQKGGITLGIWPNVPPGVDVYAWTPHVGNSPQKIARHQWGMAQINGFYVSYVPFHVQGLGGGHYHWESASGVYPPPPPGQSHSSGHWKMVHPGYIVWLTPATANQSASDTGPQGSSYSFNLGVPPVMAAPASPIQAAA